MLSGGDELVGDTYLFGAGEPYVSEDPKFEVISLTYTQTFDILNPDI